MQSGMEAATLAGTFLSKNKGKGEIETDPWLSEAEQILRAIRFIKSTLNTLLTTTALISMAMPG
jgi:hypothetical protein